MEGLEMALNDADRPTIIASLTAAKAETERIKAAIATLGAAVDKINAELYKIINDIRD